MVDVLSPWVGFPWEITCSGFFRHLPELVSRIVQTKVSLILSKRLGVQLIKTLKENTRVKASENVRKMEAYHVAVCGSVGSSKTSSLCSMLG